MDSQDKYMYNMFFINAPQYAHKERGAGLKNSDFKMVEIHISAKSGTSDSNMDGLTEHSDHQMFFVKFAGMPPPPSILTDVYENPLLQLCLYIIFTINYTSISGFSQINCNRLAVSIHSIYKYKELLANNFKHKKYELYYNKICSFNITLVIVHV